MKSVAPSRRPPRALVLGLLLLLAASAPLLISGYLLFQLELVLLSMVTATGLNLAIGYAGEFILCQATVVGVAAYTAGVLSLRYGWSLPATLPVAVVAGVIWQVFVAAAGLRTRGLYLGLLTFFAVLVFPDLILVGGDVTGGSLGLIGIPPFTEQGVAGSVAIPYEITLGLTAVSLFIVWALVRSGWGIRLRYLRDAPNALISAGISLASTKVIVYVVSAVPASMAGWALAYLSRSLTSQNFDLSMTLVLLAAVQLVGPGTLAGPIVGAALLEGYSQFVGPFSQFNVLGLGLLLTVTLILFPGGLIRYLALTVWPKVASVLPVSSLNRQPQMAGATPAAPERPAAREQRPEPLATEGPAMSVLRLRDLRKSFGGNKAVDGVSFDVGRQRVVALMGENGSGKTTLVNLISGFVKPDSGSVELGGVDVTGQKPHVVAHHGCSRTFQVPQVVAELTVRENIEAGLLRQHCSSVVTAIFLPWRSQQVDRRRRALAVQLCHDVGFSDADLDRDVDSLPLGLRRLVEVARSVATGADLICFDEPSAGLNDEELEDLAAVLHRLRLSGKTVLLVEHSVRFVLNSCDDIILMRSGQIDGVFRDVDEHNLPLPLQKHLRHAAVAQ
ncbi:MAG: branched-chain amino acid ABC transporter ATP-binding protein/permease [Acidimicrobiales bacterium]